MSNWSDLLRNKATALISSQELAPASVPVPVVTKTFVSEITEPIIHEFVQEKETEPIEEIGPMPDFLTGPVQLVEFYKIDVFGQTVTISKEGFEKLVEYNRGNTSSKGAKVKNNSKGLFAGKDL